MIADAIAIYELLTKKWSEYKVISALFKWDGIKMDGDENIKITKHNAENDIWFYSVDDYKNYIFIRIPTNSSCVIEKVGTVTGEKSADSKYFRYVAVPDGCIYGGTLPNVKVNFMIIGYDPKTFLNIKETQ